MRRAMLVLGVIAVCAVVSGVVWRRAEAESASTILLPQASLDDLSKKLDEIAKYQRENQQGAKQLAQILKNQETILSELAVIKVRASRR